MIESVLREHLVNSPALSALLAKYQGVPAVFQQFAPQDSDAGWDDSEKQYPFIVCRLDSTGDAERKISSQLLAGIKYADSGPSADDIIPVLKSLVDGYFFTPESGDTMAAAWAGTGGFTEEPGQKVYGSTVSFSLMAFPDQTTNGPDPVQVMNKWTKEHFKNAVVTGIDPLPKVFKPSDEAPVIYWRLQGLVPSKLTGNYNTTWIGCNLQCHVMTSGEKARNAVIKTMSQDLSSAVRLFFEDRSPLFLDSLTVNTGADVLKSGQITLNATYGFLREYPDAEILRYAKISEKG